ncbi:MAG: NAD(P)/FAD-dependent oxidoreductase [Candidatus Acidiferrales bacterium]
MNAAEHSTNVLVVGGGPSGLAAAIAARLRGFSVLVVDTAEPPIDKACGEGLMPDGVEALRQIGVAIPSAESVPFRGIRFIGDDRRVEGGFPQGPGLGVRRISLHRLLFERAEQQGVSFFWKARVTGLDAGGVWVQDRFVRAQWVIGADGLNSYVRRWAGLDRFRFHLEPQRFGFRRHFRIAPWTDFVEVYWGPGCQVYVTPVGPEEVGVAAISSRPQFRLEKALSLFPDLAARLQDAAPVTSERGAATASRTLKRVYRGRVVLIGDASGTVDAVSGEGLGLAFRQALALAPALESGDLSPYQSTHRSLTRVPLRLTSLMLLLDRSSWLRRRALRALASNPHLFQRMLAAHVGAVSAPGLMRDGISPLVLQMLKGAN